MEATARTADRALPEVFISRVFEAPLDLVFRMWTDPVHLKKWSCPKGFTIPFAESDIRPGGSLRVCMRSPDGTDHWLSGTYREVVPLERLSFTHAWEDEQGRPTHETLVTVSFSEVGDGRTRVTLYQAFFATESSRDGHREGWNETLDNLAEYLAT